MLVFEKVIEVKFRQICWLDEIGEGKIDDWFIVFDCLIFLSLGSGGEDSVLEEEINLVFMIFFFLRFVFFVILCVLMFLVFLILNISVSEEILVWKQMRMVWGLILQLQFGDNVGGNLSFDLKFFILGFSCVGCIGFVGLLVKFGWFGFLFEMFI